jgi:hypothetical protein
MKHITVTAIFCVLGAADIEAINALCSQFAGIQSLSQKISLLNFQKSD